MHVLFIVYADHDNISLRTEKFIDEDKNIVEELAKNWLYDELKGWCFNNIEINDDDDKKLLSKNDIDKIFVEKSFDDFTLFVNYYTNVRVEYELYSH